MQPTEVGELKAGFNKNVELLGFAYFLGYESIGIEADTMEIGGIPVPKKNWHAYGYAFSREYADFRNSKNLQNTFALADHLWLDTLLSLLLRLEDVPNAQIPEDLDPAIYIGFSKTRDPEEALENVTRFLEGFNAFYREVDFESYLKESEPFYQKAREEIAGSLPKSDFIPAMEHYFKKDFHSYTLIPSLTIPKGMGFGLRLSGGRVYNVFGALDVQQISNMDSLQLGFSNTRKLRELSIHEFGHSFVNPVVAKVPDSVIQQTSPLFEPIRDAIYAQGYNTWKSCLYEHFVRSVELYISEKHDTPEAYQALYSEYLNDRRFSYIPLILDEIRQSVNRDQPFEHAVAESMERLRELVLRTR